MAKSTFWRRLETSARAIQAHFDRETLPDTLIVLGSGFKGFEKRLKESQFIELGEIVNFPVPRVAGHGSSLVIGRIGSDEREIAVLTGRVHLYEGYDASEVVYPIRTLSTLGVQKVLLTNAAGSVDPAIQPGTVMIADDQINFTGRNCLCGADANELGPIFVDMGAVYDQAWIDAIRKTTYGARAARGVYAGMLGPAYETPAETRMLRAMGASVAGMSTVQEAMAAHQLKMRTVALSFVTNMAGGLGGALTHEDVVDLVAQHQESLYELLEASVLCDI